MWKALEISTKLPIKKMMSQWSWQPGFPIVYLDRHDDHLTSQQVFQPRQHPSFLLLYSAGGSSFNASRALAWSLPVLTQFSGGDLGLGKMEFELQTTMEGSVKYMPPEHWLKLNRGQVSAPSSECTQ